MYRYNQIKSCVMRTKLDIYSMATKVVSFNSAHGEVYSIQNYVIKFDSDLQQVGGFLRVLRFPSPIKLTATMALTAYVVVNPTIMRLQPRRPLFILEYTILTLRL
jgi:hypothetical protein